MIDRTQNEAETRKAIDEKLEAAGWVIQDKKRLNLMESTGVAVRDKFEGQQICDDESYLKGRPDQLLDQEEEWLATQLERDQNLSIRFKKYLMKLK